MSNKQRERLTGVKVIQLQHKKTGGKAPPKPVDMKITQEQFLYMSIIYLWHGDRKIWPVIDEIAFMVDRSTSMTYKVLRALQRKGLLQGPGKGKRDGWHLTMDGMAVYENLCDEYWEDYGDDELRDEYYYRKNRELGEGDPFEFMNDVWQDKTQHASLRDILGDEMFFETIAEMEVETDEVKND